MLICLSSAAIRKISMKLGMTCVSHGVLQIPNTLSAPKTSSAVNNTSAMINGFHAARYLRCFALSNIVSASTPAIRLRKTVVMIAMPYTQSYGVNTIFYLFLVQCVRLMLFKGFERTLFGVVLNNLELR